MSISQLCSVLDVMFSNFFLFNMFTGESTVQRRWKVHTVVEFHCSNNESVTAELQPSVSPPANKEQLSVASITKLQPFAVPLSLLSTRQAREGMMLATPSQSCAHMGTFNFILQLVVGYCICLSSLFYYWLSLISTSPQCCAICTTR